MQFSASVSTVIRATPDGFFVSENTYEVSIPSSLNNWLAWCPKMSLPVLQMKETLPPRRATVTAWLAPLPPGFMKKVPPMTVSPGRGKCPVQMTISVFELPITRIFDSDMVFFLCGCLSRPAGSYRAGWCSIGISVVLFEVRVGLADVGRNRVKFRVCRADGRFQVACFAPLAEPDHILTT